MPQIYLKREVCQSCTSNVGGASNNLQPLTPQFANEHGYHINWVAESAPCGGAGDSGGVPVSGGYPSPTVWEAYCWQSGICNGVKTTIRFPPGEFTETPVIVSALHGTQNNADARGGNAIYAASPEGFTVYVHSTAGANNRISVNEVNQWGWKIVYLATLDSRHSGKGAGGWVDAGPNTVESTICHGGVKRIGRAGGTTNYVTSITGSSHHWTSDGAGSIYSPTPDRWALAPAESRTWFIAP